MQSPRLKFALFGNIFQSKKSVHINRVLSYLDSRGVSMCMERMFYDFLLADGKIAEGCVEVFDGDEFSADFVISMGGDGTLLRAASMVRDKNIPIIGINMGRLGFLADILPDEIETALDDLFAGEYKIEKHSVISIETEGHVLEGVNFALNDIAVLKRDNASMISIKTKINGEDLVTYQADGLIVSTPTGSTAYSLSNGGPIIVPETGILCLTPVAPHSLNIRPIVIKDDSKIELSVESRNHNFLIAIDGRSEKCAEHTRLTIQKAPYMIRIVKRSNHGYFSTLREKMMWGADTR